jgi:hypothetical protein
LLLLAWFLFMTSASFWLPIYKGDVDVGAGETTVATVAYAAVAALGAAGVRGQVRSRGYALVSALPALALLAASALALLAASALAGYLINQQGAEFRGEPVFLYFGVTLWASWAALVFGTALTWRIRWNGLVGIAIGLVVATLGLFAFVARID